ncbi:MAG: hypothetical protein LUC98_03710 [Lachnospiraceae bacterium]|nr:hypothetical protein [Lachnospiraceae bacterium]
MKRKRFHFEKALLLILTLCCLTGCKNTSVSTVSSEISETIAQQTSDAEAEASPYSSSLAVDKAETVYVKAQADGTPTEITVETELRNPDPEGLSPISDFSTLSDIKNTEGDEAFTQDADGSLTWENQGADISYKGTTRKELPVNVLISYYLDDQEIETGDLAGRSGRLRIRFDYENQTAEEVEVNGGTVSTKVPFTAITLLYLSSDIFSNMEITNGSLVSLGSQEIALGFALPGLAEYLELTDYELTEDLEIPEYVEFCADVTNFELDFTATILTPGLFSEMEESDLDELDDLIADMKELGDASSDLVEGTEELYDGTSELYDGPNELLDGVTELRDGVKEYTDGVWAVDAGLDTVNYSLYQLTLSNEELQASMQALAEGLTGLDAALGAVELPGSGADASAGELTAEQLALYGQLAAFQSQLDALQESVSQLAAGSQLLSDGVKSYTDAAYQIYQGTKELSAGSAELANARYELNDGMQELLDAVEGLNEGVGELNDGVEELRDGVKEFDEAGIRKITDLFGDDLAALIIKLRALKIADDTYQNFGGITDGQTGSVRFLIETEEIAP